MPTLRCRNSGQGVNYRIGTEASFYGMGIYRNYTKTNAERRAMSLSSWGTICQTCEISLLLVLLLVKKGIVAEIKTSGNVVIHCSKSPYCVGVYWASP